MIHKLAFTKVDTSTNLIKFVVRCTKCGEAELYEVTPSQLVLLLIKKDKSKETKDKFYYSCKKRN